MFDFECMNFLPVLFLKRAIQIHCTGKMKSKFSFNSTYSLIRREAEIFTLYMHINKKCTNKFDNTHPTISAEDISRLEATSQKDDKQKRNISRHKRHRSSSAAKNKLPAHATVAFSPHDQQRPWHSSGL